MGLLDTIFGGSVGKLVQDVVGTFKLSPESRLEFDREMAAREHELRKLDVEVEAKIAEIASSNIRAEAASDSWLSKNCRPFFVFGAGAVLILNVLLPLISQFTPKPIVPLDIAEWFYGAFITGFTGYAYFRTQEKQMRLK